jgi:anti-anti-sigma regulatory factor
MALEFAEKNEWLYIPAPGRLDSFNFDVTKTDLDQLVARCNQVAIDVSGAQFISIPMIKYLHGLAVGLAERGGRLALVGPSEKFKRQIGIFASPDPFVFLSADNWDRLVNTSAVGKA